VLSSQTEADFYHRSTLSVDKLLVIPPGVTPIAEPKTGQPTLRNILRLPEAARLIFCVGPLHPYKGFQDAIWTFDILKYLYDNLQLVMLGDGPDRNRLKHFTRGTGRTASVHFLDCQSDPQALLSEADITWVPSRRAGGVQVVLDAMAAGRPVIASRLPILAELVDEGETGFLVPPGDKQAWGRRTRVLLDNPERGRAMGEAGRRRVRNEFPATRFIERYASLYETLAER
jgi:glycosyltransferase involved in cell wall biosynthesis